MDFSKVGPAPEKGINPPWQMDMKMSAVWAVKTIAEARQPGPPPGCNISREDGWRQSRSPVRSSRRHGPAAAQLPHRSRAEFGNGDRPVGRTIKGHPEPHQHQRSTSRMAGIVTIASRRRRPPPRKRQRDQSSGLTRRIVKARQFQRHGPRWIPDRRPSGEILPARKE